MAVDESSHSRNGAWHRDMRVRATTARDEVRHFNGLPNPRTCPAVDESLLRRNGAWHRDVARTDASLPGGGGAERRGRRRLVRRDRVLVRERQADLVEALEQAVALERVDVERVAAGSLRLEVDGQLLPRPRTFGEVAHLLLRQRHRQEADLEAVL